MRNSKITKSEDQLTSNYKEAEDYASETIPKYSVQEETNEKAQKNVRPRVPVDKTFQMWVEAFVQIYKKQW